MVVHNFFFNILASLKATVRFNHDDHFFCSNKGEAAIFNSVEKGSDDDAGFQILQFIARPSAPYDCLQAMNAQAT